jgi:hypothetical protein
MAAHPKGPLLWKLAISNLQNSMTYDRQTHLIMDLSCECIMINSETILTSEDHKMSTLNIKDAIQIYILLYIMYNCGMEAININTRTRYLL